LFYESGNLFAVKKQLLQLILLITLVNCQKRAVEKPVWLNKSIVVQVPQSILQFKTDDKEWKATLQSFVQPIPLQISYHHAGFSVQLQNKEGILTGPAKIILNKGDQYFYYDIFLANKQILVTKKDYRSPKTVNPDSSLQQQSIVFQIDRYRNIMGNHNSFFKEEMINLSPKANTYRAIANKPLTAYYVQPGSCRGIYIKSKYNKEKKQFVVTAGPLKDKYNNTVADGTLVAFIYNDKVNTWRMEATLLDGLATVLIPAKDDIELFAQINEIISNTILLKP
jgi:hypothetical protein